MRRPVCVRLTGARCALRPSRPSCDAQWPCSSSAVSSSCSSAPWDPSVHPSIGRVQGRARITVSRLPWEIARPPTPPLALVQGQRGGGVDGSIGLAPTLPVGAAALLYDWGRYSVRDDARATVRHVPPWLGAGCWMLDVAAVPRCRSVGTGRELARPSRPCRNSFSPRPVCIAGGRLRLVSCLVHTRVAQPAPNSCWPAPGAAALCCSIAGACRSKHSCAGCQVRRDCNSAG